MKPNSKFKIRNSKLNSEGFTLVELLTSIIVLVAIGSVISGIITSSLRGANKTNVIEKIRQNGNYTLLQIAKNIEYAQVFSGLSNDGSTYVTNCPYSSSPTPSPVPTQYKYIKVTGVDGNPIVYHCDSANPITLTANDVPLIDADYLSLKDCIITCTQTRSADVPIIRINFKLGSENENGFVENTTSPLQFETSVTIKNYKK